MASILNYLIIVINIIRRLVHGDMDRLCRETIGFQDTYVLPQEDDIGASNK